MRASAKSGRISKPRGQDAAKNPRTERPARPGKGERVVTLAIDVGNTQIGIGVLDGDRIDAQIRLSSGIPRTEDELLPIVERLLAPHREALTTRGRGVIASVVPSLTETFALLAEKLLGVPSVLIQARMVQGLAIDVPEPESVGADRLANAVAVAELYRVPAVVVDLGTATNFDVVLEGPRFVGGVIAPGIVSSAEELFRRGARLPKVEITRPDHVVGRTTVECLQSGVYFGAVAQIDGLVDRIAKELGTRPFVVATGGLAQAVARDSRTIRAVDPALTLQGIRILGERARKTWEPGRGTR